MDINELASLVDEYSVKNKIGIKTAYHECCVFLSREDKESEEEFKQIKTILFNKPRTFDDPQK